jgi:hypothetical protein
VHYHDFISSHSINRLIVYAWALVVAMFQMVVVKVMVLAMIVVWLNR